MISNKFYNKVLTSEVRIQREFYAFPDGSREDIVCMDIIGRRIVVSNTVGKIALFINDLYQFDVKPHIERPWVLHLKQKLIASVGRSKLLRINDFTRQSTAQTSLNSVQLNDEISALELFGTEKFMYATGNVIHIMNFNLAKLFEFSTDSNITGLASFNNKIVTVESSGEIRIFN